MNGSRFATWPVQAGEMLRKITVHVAQSDERDGRLFAQIPNFSTDLNAMHEAEKVIVDWVFWRIQLSHVVGIGYAPDLDICEDIKSFASAKAHQRAEAFLRTIGKYSDATHPLP